MKGFIYKITNRVNGKVYIGQTRYTIEHRWKQHCKNYSIEHRKQPLYLAFAKYGIENFSVEPVEEVDVNDLDEREIFWIAKYNSFKKGYNATLGGKGGRTVFWTDSSYDEIRTLYLSGFSTVKIAELYNVHSGTILSILKSMNVKTKSNTLDINAREREEIISSYSDGMSLRAIAQKYNTDAGTIKRYLIKYGVEIRPFCSLLKDEEKQKEIISQFIKGITFRDIEKQFHTDTRTIKKILKLHDIDYKDVKRPYSLTSSECLFIIKDYNSNIPVKDIAQKYNINVCTIYEVLKKYHVNNKRYNNSKSVHSLKSLEQGENVLQ